MNLFRLMKLSPEDGEGSGGGGSGEGGEGEGGKGGGEEKWYDKISADDVLTTKKLQGILGAAEAKTTKQIESALEKATAGLPESVKSAVQEAMKTAVPEDGKGGGKDGKGDDETAIELAALRRKLDEASTQIGNLQGDLKGEKDSAKAVKKKGLILAALTKADCTKPDVALAYIENNIVYDPDKGKAYVVQDNGFGGEEHVDLDDYVTKEVRVSILPELFKGANRPGSPASGDEGVGAGEAKYDWNKIKDNTTVLSSEEFQKALDAGQVANMPKSAPAPAR